MESYSDIQKAWRKRIREDTKRIETILHPNPTINGVEICHEHTRNGKIRFTAWVGSNPLHSQQNLKQIVLSRDDVLRLSKNDFWILYRRDFEWLTTNN